jgi:hypothetical protein
LVDRDSAAGITTLYGLDGPETESRWGEGGKFPAPVLTGPGDFLAFYKTGTGSISLRRKRSKRGVDHPPHLISRWDFMACSAVKLYFMKINIMYYLIGNRKCLSFEQNIREKREHKIK